jgi:hypothetical protein
VCGVVIMHVGKLTEAASRPSRNLPLERQAEERTAVGEVCRKAGISDFARQGDAPGRVRQACPTAVNGRIGDDIEIAGDAHHALMGEASFELAHRTIGDKG